MARRKSSRTRHSIPQENLNRMARRALMEGGPYERDMLLRAAASGGLLSGHISLEATGECQKTQ